MRNTIKAKNGYTVKNLKNNRAAVYDGDKKLFVGELRTMADYTDEYVNGNNECAVKYEVFTTVDNKQYVYWADSETTQDFLTLVTLGGTL